jgi:acyl transferase domain-containing protein
MMALLAPPEVVTNLLGTVANVEIAAFNSPRAITVAGPGEGLAELKRLANRDGIVALELDLDYPFHTALIANIEGHLLSDLDKIVPLEGSIPFVSTVTGSCLPRSRLNARYWWRNMREPVQFVAGIRAAAKLGARFFVEIGPRSTLLKHISDSLAGEAKTSWCFLLDRHDQERDPVDKLVSGPIAGARLDTTAVLARSGRVGLAVLSLAADPIPLRADPGGHQPRRDRATPVQRARTSGDALEWYAHLDTALFPQLADHKVGEQLIFPGTGFLEIAFAIAGDWLRAKQVLLADFEILKPLDLSKGETREVMSRVSPGSNTIEIFSRPRLSQAGWVLHSRAKMLHGEAGAVAPSVPSQGGARTVSRDAIYRLAASGGLHYGPAFCLLESAVIYENNLIADELAPAKVATAFAIDPMRLDCCGHGIVTLLPQLKANSASVICPCGWTKRRCWFPAVCHIAPYSKS